MEGWRGDCFVELQTGCIVYTGSVLEKVCVSSKVWLGIWQLASCVFFTGNYTVSGGCWMIINIFLPTGLSDPASIPPVNLTIFAVE